MDNNTNALDADFEDPPALDTDTPHPNMSFRFMDLPAELRLMVYAHLPRQIKHTVVSQPDVPNSKVILITRHIPAAILRTCRTVYQEANKIVQDIIKDHVLDATPRMFKSKLGRPLVQKLLHEIGDEAQFFLAFPKSVGYHLEDTRERIGPPRYCVFDESQLSNVHRFIHQTIKICTNNQKGYMNWSQPLEVVRAVGRNRWNYDLVGSSSVIDACFLERKDEFVFRDLLVPEPWIRYPLPNNSSAMSVDALIAGWLPT